jgi:hypothetical protein
LKSTSDFLGFAKKKKEKRKRNFTWLAFNPISLCGFCAICNHQVNNSDVSLKYTKKEKESSSYRLPFCGWLVATIARLGTTFSDAMVRGCSQVQVVINRKGGGHIGGRERRVKIDGSQKIIIFPFFYRQELRGIVR